MLAAVVKLRAPMEHVKENLSCWLRHTSTTF